MGDNHQAIIVAKRKYEEIRKRRGRASVCGIVRPIELYVSIVVKLMAATTGISNINKYQAETFSNNNDDVFSYLGKSMRIIRKWR